MPVDNFHQVNLKFFKETFLMAKFLHFFVDPNQRWMYLHNQSTKCDVDGENLSETWENVTLVTKRDSDKLQRYSSGDWLIISVLGQA